MNIPYILQNQIRDHLPSSHIGIEKTKILVRESVYWFNMNADIENNMKQCTTCLEYQQMQSEQRALLYEIPCRPWEVVSANVFMVNKKYFCVL